MQDARCKTQGGCRFQVSSLKFDATRKTLQVTGFKFNVALRITFSRFTNQIF